MVVPWNGIGIWLHRVSCLVMSDSATHGLWPTRFLCPWNSPSKNTAVGSHSLLPGIFQTQGLNPGLLHCGWILYHLSHQGSSRILKWVVYPFSRRSSWPRIWNVVSCTTGRFLTSWATRESVNIISLTKCTSLHKLPISWAFSHSCLTSSDGGIRLHLLLSLGPSVTNSKRFCDIKGKSELVS